MTIIQIFALIFGLFALSRATLRIRDKKLSIGEFLFWNVIWLGLLVVVFFPDLTTQVAQHIGIGRGIDVIVYSSIGLLFYLIFRIYVKMEEIEQEITKIVREIAFMKKKK